MSELSMSDLDKVHVSNQGRKYRIKVNLNETTKRTSIIVSYDNRLRLFNLGKYGETYDDIIDRIVQYDIELSKKRKEKKVNIQS